MARRLAVEIIGDSSSLERAFKRSGQSAQKFNGEVGKAGKGKMFGGLTKAAGLAGAALGVGGLASAAKAAFTEMGDAQKVSAQTAAALKSTGGAANVTAKHMDDLAGSLLKVSGTDDEAIKSGENLLLTFTQIQNQAGKGNDIFDQATRTMLDMSTALGQDTKTSAIQLGKALNNPIKGITALQRVGVSFTDGQKKQIAQMVKTGNTIGAQKVILAELTKEFGGSAEAAGSTLPGKLNILKETLLNLGGTIAEQLTPQITAVVTSITDWLSKSENQQAILNAVKTAVSALGTVVGVLKAAFDALSFAVGGNKNAIIVLVAAYATFKAVQIASTVTQLASSFGGLAARTRGATTATRGLTTSMIGKAGLVAAAGVASYELTTMALKATHLDKKLRDLGGTAFDVAANLGLVKDPMAKFEGKALPSRDVMLQIRKQAAQLEAGGRRTTPQAVSILAKRFPNVSRYEIEGLAGLRSRLGYVSTTNIGTVHVHASNVRELEEQLHKRTKQRPHRRRGT